MGRGIIVSLRGPVGGLSELIHINTSCPWHIRKTGKVFILMIVMMMILECLVCANFTVIVLFQTHKLQKTESVYIYI